MTMTPLHPLPVLGLHGGGDGFHTMCATARISRGTIIGVCLLAKAFRFKVDVGY